MSADGEYTFVIMVMMIMMMMMRRRKRRGRVIIEKDLSEGGE